MKFNVTHPEFEEFVAVTLCNLKRLAISKRACVSTCFSTGIVGSITRGSRDKSGLYLGDKTF